MSKKWLPWITPFAKSRKMAEKGVSEGFPPPSAHQHRLDSTDGMSMIYSLIIACLLIWPTSVLILFFSQVLLYSCKWQYNIYMFLIYNKNILCWKEYLLHLLIWGMSRGGGQAGELLMMIFINHGRPWPFVEGGDEFRHGGTCGHSSIMVMGCGHSLMMVVASHSHWSILVVGPHWWWWLVLVAICQSCWWALWMSVGAHCHLLILVVGPDGQSLMVMVGTHCVSWTLWGESGSDMWHHVCHLTDMFT